MSIVSALIRLAALVALAAVAVLAAGHGMSLLGAVDRVAGRIGPLPRDAVSLTPAVVAGGLAVGAATATIEPTGRAVGQIVTLLHELGHTLVAAALGAQPAGIVLRHDASGHATARWHRRAGPVRRLSFAVTAFAGLPAPAVAAAAGAGLLAVTGPRAVLWSVAGASVAVALLARSLWSLLVAGGLAGLAVAALADAVQAWAAGAVVALLGAIAVKAVTDAARRLFLPIAEGDDARAVQRGVLLPARLVQFVQVATTAAAGAWTMWQIVATTS